MVSRCVAVGCSDTASDRICLFKFPKDPELRKQWEKQVQRTRAHWKATEHSHICSEHFTSDAFQLDSAIDATFGMNKKKTLKLGAVPTLFIRQSAAANPGGRGDEIRSQKRTAITPAKSEIESISNPKGEEL